MGVEISFEKGRFSFDSGVLGWRWAPDKYEMSPLLFFILMLIGFQPFLDIFTV